MRLRSETHDHHCNNDRVHEHAHASWPATCMSIRDTTRLPQRLWCQCVSHTQPETSNRGRLTGDRAANDPHPHPLARHNTAHRQQLRHDSAYDTETECRDTETTYTYPTAARPRLHQWSATVFGTHVEPATLAVGDYVLSPPTGYIFQWTQQHMVGAQLDAWRYEGDPVIDHYLAATENARPDSAGIDHVNLMCPTKETVTPYAQKVRNQCDESSGNNNAQPIHQARVQPKVHKAHDEPAQTDDAHKARCAMDTPPPWRVDWDAVGRGQAVFLQHWLPASMTLRYLSLVGGFSAPLITEVLRCTGYLTSAERSATRQRLQETFQMVVACVVGGSETLYPGGDAWKEVVRVRVLHAKVRRRFLTKGVTPQGESHRPWKVDEHGVPINQEDLAVTLLAFSLNVIHGIELVRGWPLSQQEQEDYMRLWAVIGWAMGISHSHNPCCRGLEHAHCMLESILMHQLEPNQHSRDVAANLLPAATARALAQPFLGPDLFTALGFQRPQFWHAAAASVIFWIIRIITWVTAVPGVSTLWYGASVWLMTSWLRKMRARNPMYAFKTPPEPTEGDSGSTRQRPVCPHLSQ
eukprot:m.173341 g.173341  ORF g.173341 m.173341 type:complete len:580 (-) comp13681_c0_seq1:1472-3211(-)